MGLSRRRFTRGFKLAAVQRLEQGVSIAEAARAMEVNLNVLRCWRKGNPWDNAACESFMASSKNSRKRTVEAVAGGADLEQDDAAGRAGRKTVTPSQRRPAVSYLHETHR